MASIKVRKRGDCENEQETDTLTDEDDYVPAKPKKRTRKAPVTPSPTKQHTTKDVPPSIVSSETFLIDVVPADERLATPAKKKTVKKSAIAPGTDSGNKKKVAATAGKKRTAPSETSPPDNKRQKKQTAAEIHVCHVRSVARAHLMDGYKQHMNETDYSMHMGKLMRAIEQLEDKLYEYARVTQITSYAEAIRHLCACMHSPEFVRKYGEGQPGMVLDATKLSTHYTDYLVFGNCKTRVSADWDLFQSDYFVDPAACAEHVRDDAELIFLKEEEVAKYDYLQAMSLNVIFDGEMVIRGDIICRGCNQSDMVYSRGLQTRSLDEGETIFSRCKRCNKFWRS